MTQRTNDPALPTAPMDGADPARLAALLDGRLSGAERDELLARLADDDEDLAIFAEAAAIQRELEAESEASAIPHIEPATAEAEDEAADVPGVLPLRRPAARPARGVDRRWLAAAAVLAGLALTPFAWRATQGGAVRGPSQTVAMLGNSSPRLPVDYDKRSWPQSRSEGEAVTDEGRPVRLGAYGVNLEVAARAGDVENTRMMAARIQALLTDAPGGSMAAGSFQSIVARPDAPAAELLPMVNDANRAAAEALDPDRYALGAWAEAARLAAAGRDAAFFRDRRTRRTLKRAETLVEDDEAARAALAAVRTSAGSDAPDWAGLRENVDRLLAAIGR